MQIACKIIVSIAFGKEKMVKFGLGQTGAVSMNGIEKKTLLSLITIKLLLPYESQEMPSYL